MLRKHTTLLLLPLACLWLIVGAAQTQQTDARTDVKLRPHKRQIMLTVDGHVHLLDVSAQIGAAKLGDVTPLLFTRRTDFNYLLAAACGPSKLKPDMHECGAGTECDLLWLKLTPAWRIADARAALYESCWQSATSDDGYQLDKGILRVEYDNFLWKHHYQLTYDAEQPERGLIVVESALKAN